MLVVAEIEPEDIRQAASDFDWPAWIVRKAAEMLTTVPQLRAACSLAAECGSYFDEAGFYYDNDPEISAMLIANLLLSNKTVDDLDEV